MLNFHYLSTRLSLASDYTNKYKIKNIRKSCTVTWRKNDRTLGVHCEKRYEKGCSVKSYIIVSQKLWVGVSELLITLLVNSESASDWIVFFEIIVFWVKMIWNVYIFRIFHRVSFLCNIIIWPICRVLGCMTAVHDKRGQHKWGFFMPKMTKESR